MQRVVKPLINGRVLVCVAILSAAMALLCIGLSYWLAFGDFSRDPGVPWILFQAFLPLFAIVFVVLAIGSTWGAWSMLRLDRQRQAATHASSANNVLAIEQPSAHTAPLALPLTISIRTTRALKVAAWSCGGALFVVGYGIGDFHGAWDIGFFLRLLPGLGVGSMFALAFSRGMQMEVADDQLTVYRSGRKEIVPWKEARLFAITRGRHATLTYELSSSHTRITWAWVRPGTFSARLYEPTISQYEYDRQMEALLALIAAKTGLRLNDLR